jgi:kumamolisin
MVSAAGAALAGCAGSPSHVAGGASLRPPVAARAAQLSLTGEMSRARDLGPLAASQRITFTLSLAARDPAGERAQVASGTAISRDSYIARFGPDAASVATARTALAAAGLSSTWEPGDPQMSVSGRADAAERLLDVSVHSFLGADGRQFHAPLHPASVPAALGSVVVAVTGLDNFVSTRTAALLPSDTHGFTPADAAAFYDITPLYNAHLDGTGQTVVFIDWSMPTSQTLQQYAQKFTPSHPFDVTVVSDAANWGAPLQQGDKQWADTAGETALDLETAHGIAPGAKEVVYAFSDPSAIPAVITAIVQRFPKAIVSSSIGPSVSCEAEQGAKQVAAALDQAMTAAAAQGLTIMWASGDRGAYACLPDYPDGDPKANTEVSVGPDAASSGATSVGGTVVFLGAGASYGQEAAWGEPSEQWGGGGGVSTLIARPAWQNAPGVPGDMTGRGVPDVSANSDSLTGWDTFAPDGQDPSQTAEQPVGGTSAAAPFWAAVTALIDQDLTAKSLPLVGFANPALYTFAQSPSGLPAPAFHDITLGTNLHYAAATGWDAASGLGTPDVAALADDFEWYGRTHGAPS